MSDNHKLAFNSDTTGPNKNTFKTGLSKLLAQTLESLDFYFYFYAALFPLLGILFTGVGHIYRVF